MRTTAFRRPSVMSPSRGLALMVVAWMLAFVGAAVGAANEDLAQPTKAVLLLADLEGPSEARAGVTRQLATRLSAGAGAYRDLEVKRLGEVIATDQGADVAVEKAAAQGAAVVVWGRFTIANGEPSISVRFGFVKNAIVSDANSPFVNRELLDVFSRLEIEPPAMEPAAVVELLLAETRLALADTAGALSHYSAVLQLLKPDQVAEIGTVYLCRSAADVIDNDIDRAFPDINQAIARLPDPTLAYALRGVINAMQGDDEHAVADHSEAIRRKPENFRYYLWRATSYDPDQGRLRAMADFDEAIRLKPKTAEIYLARAMYFEAIDDHVRAFADYGEAIRLSPNSAENYERRGKLHLEKKNLEQAVSDFTEAIRLDPKAASPYAERARARLEQGRLQAIADYKEGLKRSSPGDKAPILRALANLFGQLGDVAQACNAEASRLEDGFVQYHIDRAKSFTAKGELTRAIAEYDEAIQLDDYAELHSLRARCHELKGDLDAAIADCTVALEQIDRGLPDSDVSSYAAELHDQRAQLCRFKGDLDSAISDYDAAIRLQPEKANYYRGRAECHASKRNLDQAISDLNRAIALNPDEPDAYYSRGNAYREKREYDKAIADLSRAIALKHNFAAAYYCRGLARDAMGQADMAAADRKKALELDEDVQLHLEAGRHTKELEKK